jgi:hypothetical protein
MLIVIEFAPIVYQFVAAADKIRKMSGAEKKALALRALEEAAHVAEDIAASERVEEAGNDRR